MMHYSVHKRGYGPVFRSSVTNVCPGCGRSHWHVGRKTAECAFCATALPLAQHQAIMLDDGSTANAH